MISSFTLAMGNIGAARKLHHNLLLNKLHTPQSFFDTTPIGRIINRFSKDIYVIDEALPATVLMLLGTVFVSLSTIIVIVSSTPIFLVVIVPLAFIYVFVQVFEKMLPNIFLWSSFVNLLFLLLKCFVACKWLQQHFITFQFSLGFLCTMSCIWPWATIFTLPFNQFTLLFPQPKHFLFQMLPHPVTPTQPHNYFLHMKYLC